MTIKKCIAGNLKRVIKENNIKKQDLSHHLGMKPTSLSKALSGNHAGISIEKLVMVADYADVPICEFFKGWKNK